MKAFENLLRAQNPQRLSDNLEAHRAVPMPVSAPRAIVASGERINIRSADEVTNLRNRVYTEWQNESWAYYDAIGEIKYGFGLVAAVMSRIRIYPALNVDADSVPISVTNFKRRKIDQSKGEQEKDIAAEMDLPKGLTPEVLKYFEQLIRNLFSGIGGASGFMRSYALNMSVAGECYLVNYKGQWSIRSTHEITAGPNGTVILRRQRSGANSSTTAAGTVPGDIELPKNAYVGRIWREHPRYSMEPESSMLGLREACDELITLQRMIRTVARSRMNAGLLFLPDGLTAAGASIAEDIASEEEEADAITASIYDSITAPIEDETSAASVVPAMVTGPAEAGKAILKIDLFRQVDQFLVDRCERSLERILQGLDMPKDVVSGMANVKYSNAIQIDESLYKGHIEPLALMLCDSLTMMYLYPALKAQFKHLTQEDLDFLRVWYDPSEVVTKSDPAQSANTGYDNFAISSATWRAAHGFSDTDAPSEKELALRYLLTKGTPQPEQLAVLFREAFPTITEEQRAKSLKDSPVPMPESAQKILYDKVVAPVSETSRNGKPAGDAASGNPTRAEPVAKTQDQFAASRLRDLSAV